MQHHSAWRDHRDYLVAGRRDYLVHDGRSA
jgi:hypothetical protein